MIGHVSSRLRLLSVSLARHWLQTLIVGDSGKCVSSLQALLDDNRPYPGITADGYCGAQTQQAVIDFPSAHNLAGDGVVAAQTAHAINEFSRGRVFSAIRPGSRIRSWPGRVWKLTGFLTHRRPRRGSRLRWSCGRGRRSSHPPTASHDHDGRHCGTWATPLPTW